MITKKTSVLIALMIVSAISYGARVNLAGELGDLGSTSKMKSTYSRASVETENPYLGDSCLKQVAAGKGARVKRYIYFKDRFLPFQLKKSKVYTASAAVRTTGSVRARLSLGLYSKDKKYIKTLWSNYGFRPEWKRISIKFTAPQDGCYVVPIFYFDGKSDAVIFWDDFQFSEGYIKVKGGSKTENTLKKQIGNTENLKAGKNLLGSAGNFDSRANLNACYTRIAVVKDKPGQDESCLKVTSVGEGKKIRHCIYFKERFLPFEFNSGKYYTVSVLMRASGKAKGRLYVELYDKNKKYIKTICSGYGYKKEWRPIGVSFFPPKDICYAIPSIYIYAKGEDAVFLKKLNVSFQAKKQLIYLKKKADNKINISGIFDGASMPGLTSPKTIKAVISMKDPLNNKVVFTEEFPVKDMKLNADIDLNNYNWGIYRFTIKLLENSKEVYSKKLNYIPGIDLAWKDMDRFFKSVDSEVGVMVKEAKKVTPSKAENENGFVIFNRPEPRWIQPSSLPLKNEKVNAINRTAAPNDYIFITTAILPLKDLKNVSLSFKQDETVNAPQAKLGMLRYMPQQTNYSYRDKIPKYWILPEIIDDIKDSNLKQGRVQQYSLRLKVPANAKGNYKGNWIISVDGKNKASISILLKVLPVKLSQPEDLIMGIYIDPMRWYRNKKFTDEKISEELQDVREHGYNSLYLAIAPPIANVRFKDGYYKTDLKYFIHILKIAFKAGFDKHPYVIDPYAMERIMTPRVGLPAPKGKSYSPEYKKYVNQFFQQIKEATVKENYPEPIIHGVDEARSGEKLNQTIRTLKVAKENGFRTATTCTLDTFKRYPEFDKVIDFRIYGNPGFWDARTPKEAETARKAAEKSGDVYWSYGSGCYANFTAGSHSRNVRQDGCLSENRYLHGLFIHRAKLKAEWSWCFSRWRGDPMNDFDDPRRHRGEVKDQCIVYPTKNSTKNQDTLQWEALRQGWQDYRAIYTLEKILKERSDSKAKAIKTELDKKIKEIPWRNYTQYPSGKMEELRAWMLKKIYQLQK